ncbi:MAG: helix-turn-helix transcriptional regulator [Candidatus Nanopelagicales bacterium]|nr:helix-turn-helix transcriptional regulator [Candidatus Nanopelagicales bacterium]
MTASALISRSRRERGYSQAELARRSGIPRTAINAYERGQRTPTARTLARLVEACGLRLEVADRPGIDEQANARTLEQVLDLAQMLPVRPRKRLNFPPLPVDR